MRGNYETDAPESVVLNLAQPDGTYRKVDVAAYLADPANDLYPALLGAAREYRFSGQVGPDVYYSGAHHALLVSALVNLVYEGSEAAILGGLLHDLPEAFLRDLATPIKKIMRSMGDHTYDSLHRQLDRALEQRFGLLLTPEDLIIIAKADALALRVEQTIFQSVKHEDLTPEDGRGISVIAVLGSMIQEVLADGRAEGLPVHLSLVQYFADGLDAAVEQYQESMPLN